MSVEYRLSEEVLVVYCELRDEGQDPLPTIELKVKKVKTLGEATSLEHELLSRWAERLRHEEKSVYLPPPWPPDFGSPTTQVFTRLLTTTLSMRVVSEEG